MIALYILAGLVVLCWLAGHIRIGVRVLYNREGPAVFARLGPATVRVFPRPKKQPGAGEAKKPKPKKKKKPAKKPKEEEPKAPTPLPERIGGALEYAGALLPPVLDMGRRFAGKLQVDTLVMELTAGAADPADAAMRYGQAQAALGALWYPLTEAFQVKDGHAWVRADFDAPGMTLYVEAALSVRIGQILWIGLSGGLRAARAFFQVRGNRKRTKKEARKAV